MDGPSKPRVVWFTPDRDRFFAVPPEVTLPPGPVELHRVGGAPAWVDADAMAAWAIDKDEARALLGEAIEGLYDGARRVLQGLFELGRRAAELSGAEPSVVPSPTLPGRLEDLLGMPAGELVADPDRVGERLRGFLERKAAEAREAAAAEAPVEPEAPPTPAPEPDEQPVPPEVELSAGTPLTLEISGPTLADVVGVLGARLQDMARQMREQADAADVPDNVVPFPSSRWRPQGEE